MLRRRGPDTFRDTFTERCCCRKYLSLLPLQGRPFRCRPDRAFFPQFVDRTALYRMYVCPVVLRIVSIWKNKIWVMAPWLTAIRSSTHTWPRKKKSRALNGDAMKHEALPPCSDPGRPRKFPSLLWCLLYHENSKHCPTLKMVTCSFDVLYDRPTRLFRQCTGEEYGNAYFLRCITVVYGLRCQLQQDDFIPTNTRGLADRTPA